MKKKLLSFLLGLGVTLSFGVNATHGAHDCDGHSNCFAVYTDCLNQGLSSSFCINLYWTCARTCATP